MFDLKSYLIGKHGGAYTPSADLPSYLMGRKKSASIKTLTGTPPLIFNSDGSNLIDYTIHGASGGVGDEVIITGLTRPLMGLDTCKDTLDLETGVITRKIGSVEFTSSDMLSTYGRCPVWNDSNNSKIKPIADVKSMSSHFVGLTPQAASYFINYAPPGNVAIRSVGPSWVGFTMNSGETFEDFDTFINDQNQAGTPVIAFYTAKESTETVDVPYGLTGTVEGYLTQDTTPSRDNPVYPTANGVKQQDGTYNIHTGKYAIPLTINGQTYTIYLDAPLGEGESISLADTGIDIPTVEGVNTLSVDTTVQPENVTIVYNKGG